MGKCNNPNCQCEDCQCGDNCQCGKDCGEKDSGHCGCGKRQIKRLPAFTSKAPSNGAFIIYQTSGPQNTRRQIFPFPPFSNCR